MKILLIGGTQFIGPYVVKNLLESGHEVIVFHRGKINNLHSNVKHILGDRNNLINYLEEFKKISPDVVLDMIPYKEQHAIDVLNVFKGITKRIVAISSGDVYFSYDVIIKNEPGPIDPNLISEHSKLRETLFPNRKKGDISYDKIPIENLILNNKEIAGTVLRLPVVYGPNDSQHRFFNYLKRMEDKRSFIFLEEGFSNFRWTHGYVEDVAQAITLAVTHNRASGKVYNVGQLNVPTMVDLISGIGRLSGWDGEVIKVPGTYLPEHLRPHDLNTSQNLVYDTSLIRSDIGYEEICSLEEGLIKTIEWERINPKNYNIDDFNYIIEDELYKQITK
ncbi:NAD-dependent epimerase/dehydratase family protein [Paenibacillus lutrae]|uniref:NAD-dependent epimerase/dehydratase family protein n=1 Tax=Paenibacillus lutrae TaxID=2078573 RepID=A0A7X3FEJ6_9BACL|nr:NAD-dependent epimerase/dehydratase family protein [Paenibacillus lutrae]MVO98258.1 NAD-dependent epimerase/dehydratase family protein [Paenibacillus lutrae]